MNVTLVLPYPPSANRYWRTRAVRGVAMTYVSAEAKSYKSQVAWIAKEAGIRTPYVGRVHMDLELYPHRPQDWARRARRDPYTWDDTVQCIDLGNAEKVLSDALQGIVYDDDKRIWSQNKRRMTPDEHGARVVVTVRAIEVPSLFTEEEAAA